jgi:hypothetical protein
MTTTVTLNGRTIDLTKAFPLTVGDWKRLKKVGVTPSTLQQQAKEQDFEVIAAYLHYAVQKADPTVTMDEIDGLSMKDFAALSAVIGPLAGGEEVDRPFSAPSTSSAPSTAGASPTFSS